MKVSITQMQLIALLPAIQAVAGIKLAPNSKPAYSMRRNIAQINPAVMAYYSEQNKIYTDNGELSANKMQYAAPTDPDKLVAFNQLLAAMNQKLIEFEMFQIKISDLGSQPVEQGNLVALLGIMLTDDMVLNEQGDDMVLNEQGEVVAMEAPKLSLVPQSANDVA